jgi:hypothetical protein
LAAGFSTNPLANMSWINDDDIWDVEANTEEIFEANPSSIAIGATLPGSDGHRQRPHDTGGDHSQRCRPGPDGHRWWG